MPVTPGAEPSPSGRGIVVKVRGEWLGRPEPEWCPHCCLNTAVRISQAIFLGDTLMGVASFVRCLACGADLE